MVRGAWLVFLIQMCPSESRRLWGRECDCRWRRYKQLPAELAGSSGSCLHPDPWRGIHSSIKTSFYTTQFKGCFCISFFEFISTLSINLIGGTFIWNHFNWLFPTFYLFSQQFTEKNVKKLFYQRQKVHTKR